MDVRKLGIFSQKCAGDDVMMTSQDGGVEGQQQCRAKSAVNRTHHASSTSRDSCTTSRDYRKHHDDVTGERHQRRSRHNATSQSRQCIFVSKLVNGKM